MTLAQLRAELQARGFDYLSDTRCNTFLNAAYQVDICEAQDFPFLESSTTGVAPKTISDLRTIETVVDSVQNLKLSPLDRRMITDGIDSDLTTTGSPVYYYLTSGTTVAVYPANTSNSLSIRYWKVPTALSADADEPILPTRYHSLIVDGAVRRAYEDDDEGEMAAAAGAVFQERLSQMAESLMGMQQHDRPQQFIVVTADE